MKGPEAPDRQEGIIPSLIRSSARPLVIAHRGFCQLAPENTLPAFELALPCKPDLIEFDLRQSKDGQWLVLHDAELDRTTNARRTWRRRHNKVTAHTAAEIRGLDAGRWFDPRYAGTNVPLLSEALEIIETGSVPLIERKAGSAADLAAFLRQRNLIHRIVLQSFDWQFLSEIHALEPGLVLGALGPTHQLAGRKKLLGISRRLNQSWLGQAAKTGASVIVWSRKLSKRAVHLAHARRLKVWVYTVNETRLARRLLRAGVDGFITNNPPLLKAILKAPPGASPFSEP